MKRFREAALWTVDPQSYDWAREKGLSQEASRFPFPDLYLSDALGDLLTEDSALRAFLEECLSLFTGREYGHMSSLDLVDNYLQREFQHKDTWLRGIYPSPSWGEIHLDIFYDMGLFHLDDVPPRDLVLSQQKKDPDM
ncbi:MAG: hypothetical protein HFF00_05975 [Ruminiclostridium sp.]|jgi:hypothetical protein|nr:hypothetical protein [Ruminiclostridium sp.]